MDFYNYEQALDCAAAHPGAEVRQVKDANNRTAFAVNGCLNCAALTAPGEDWCERCKAMVDNNQQINEAIFAATGVKV